MKNKMKSMLICFKFYLNIIWNKERALFIYICALVLSRAASSYIWMIFFKYLLEYLSNSLYEKAIIWTVACLLSTTILELLQKALSIKESNCYYRMNIDLQTELLTISSDITYETLENPETMKRFEMAHRCVNQNCLSNYTSALIQIGSSFIVFIGALYITSSMKSWMFVLLIAVTVINSVCYTLQTQYEVERFEEQTEVSRQMEYTRFWLTDKSRAKEVRSYILQDYIVDKLKEYNDKLFAALHKFTKKQRKPYVLLEILNAIQIFVLYAYCAYMLICRDIDAGDFMLYISALIAFGSALNNIFASFINLGKNNIYIDMLSSCLDMGKRAGKRKTFHEDFLSIEFKNVSFRYKGTETDVLHNISFTLNKGEKMSLIGANGAGKSTLIKLMLGFYPPTSGVILVNGKPMDIENVDYMPVFSAVFQDYTLFSFTVEENIALGEEKASGDLEDQLADMGLGDIRKDSFITQVFSDDGIELSGGEGQKLAILRALYKNAPVIVLDEPTAALSPQSEYDIYRKFNRLTANKTVVFISHRLSSCRICDKIMLLDNGRIEAMGSHDILLEKSSLYHEMFSAQAQLYRD